MVNLLKLYGETSIAYAGLRSVQRALLYSYMEALPECISDRRLRSDYKTEQKISCKNKLIAVEKSDLI